MIKNIVQAKWNYFGGKFRQWWHNYAGGQLTKVSLKREQSIVILQKRYGYTKDQASSELQTHYSKTRLV